MSCAGCHRLTVETQRPSLESAVKWLHCFAFEEEGKCPDPDEFVLARAWPACEELMCESPIRRDRKVCGLATSLVQSCFSSSVQETPSLHARLIHGALCWAMREVHVHKTTSLTVGAAAFHAALIVNNLVYRARPARTPSPGVVPEDLTQATEPSMEHLEQLIGSTDIIHPKLHAGDIISIRVLNCGLNKLASFVASYVPPPPTITCERPEKLIIGLAVAGAVILLLALLGRQPFLLIGSLACWLPILSLNQGRKIETPNVAHLWAQQLKKFFATEDHRKLRERFARCDLLAQASTVFADTPIADLDRAARVLRTLHGMPGASLMLSPMLNDVVRSLVNGGSGVMQAGSSSSASATLRLAELGEHLLEEDGFSRGADMAAILLVELLHVATDRNEKSPIWEIIATERTVEIQGSVSMPRFLVAMFRRAAAMYDGRSYWSAREGEFVRRCTLAARALLARPALTNPHWHLLLIRCLRHFLDDGPSSVRFPPDSGCTLESLCQRVHEIHTAYQKFPDDHPVKLECARVMAMKGFIAATPDLPVRIASFGIRTTGGRPTELDAYLLRFFGDEDGVGGGGGGFSGGWSQGGGVPKLPPQKPSGPSSSNEPSFLPAPRVVKAHVGRALRKKKRKKYR